MRVRSSVLMLALAAGAACSTSAMAQSQPKKGLSVVDRNGVHAITPAGIRIGGITYPAIPHQGAPDVPQVVYDNAPPAGGFYFYANGAPFAPLDKCSLTPGPAAGGPVPLTSLDNIAFVLIAGDPGGDFDVKVDFFNTVNEAAPAGQPVNTGPLGNSLIVQFRGVPANTTANAQFYTLTTGIDITAAGITLPDDDFGVLITVVNAGTTTQHPSIRPGWNGIPAGGPSFPSVGSSGDFFYFDANVNNMIEASERYFFGGGTFVSNVFIKLTGDASGGVTGACCLADGTCAALPQSVCASRTGIYRGDGTTCPATCAAAFNEGATDAGDLPATARSVTGSGPLPGIVGALGADDADMYRIQVCDAANFIATTTTWSNLDTQLFMFRQDGTGVVADDDDPLGGTTSRLTNAIVGGAGNGTYYLAVSEYDKDPMSAGGEIWLDNPFNTERAPDGPGAAGATTSWSSAATTGGNYVIAFRGACYIGGATCYPDCNQDHALNVNDFVCFQAAFAGGNLPQADCDHNNALNVLDFVCFQGAFAAGCSQL